MHAGIVLTPIFSLLNEIRLLEQLAGLNWNLGDCRSHLPVSGGGSGRLESSRQKGEHLSLEPAVRACLPQELLRRCPVFGPTE